MSFYSPACPCLWPVALQDNSGHKSSHLRTTPRHCSMHQLPTQTIVYDEPASYIVSHHQELLTDRMLVTPPTSNISYSSTPQIGDILLMEFPTLSDTTYPMNIPSGFPVSGSTPGWGCGPHVGAGSAIRKQRPPEDLSASLLASTSSQTMDSPTYITSSFQTTPRLSPDMDPYYPESPTNSQTSEYSGSGHSPPLSFAVPNAGSIHKNFFEIDPSSQPGLLLDEDLIMSNANQTHIVKPRVCPDKVETDAANRRRSEPKYFCTLGCGSTFTKNHNLQNHLLSHKGIKPHKCKFCSQRFTRKYDAKRHENRFCRQRVGV